jgi:hypothetical protein
MSRVAPASGSVISQLGVAPSRPIVTLMRGSSSVKYRQRLRSSASRTCRRMAAISSAEKGSSRSAAQRPESRWDDQGVASVDMARHAAEDSDDGMTF